MRNIILYAILLPYILVSCSDSNDGPSCPTGYFGDDCETPFNSVYVGTWNVDQLCETSGEEDFDITFSPFENDPQELAITGMWGESDEMITVIVNPKNRRKFSQGTQPLGNSGFTIEVVEGEINKAGDHIEIEYIIYSGTTQVESCTANCSR